MKVSFFLEEKRASNDNRGSTLFWSTLEGHEAHLVAQTHPALTSVLGSLL